MNQTPSDRSSTGELRSKPPEDKPPEFEPGRLPATLTLPLHQWTELSVRLDPPSDSLWCRMAPNAAPSYTPALLGDLADLRRTIRDLFQGAPRGRPPFRYFVGASSLPGMFNLGGDLGHFLASIRSGDREELRRYAHRCCDLVHGSATGLGLPIVMINLVQGDALGGGFEAALASDVIVAERRAKFGLPEILFNLFPGMGAYSLLARRLDGVRAERIITSGRLYSAEEMHEMGLVDVLAEDGTGEEAVKDWIRRNSRRQAIQCTLRSVRNRVSSLDLKELYDVTDLWVDAAMALDDSDIRRIERLRAAQIRRLEDARRMREEDSSAPEDDPAI